MDKKIEIHTPESLNRKLLDEIDGKVLKNAKKQISRARTGLLLDQPFYGSILMKLDMVPSVVLPDGRPLWLFATNGKVIYYNPEFVQHLSIEETKGGLAHEVMHLAHLHHLRMGSREQRRWNRAGDYAINPFIKKESFMDMPKGGLIDPKFSGKASEAIYPLLPPEPKSDDTGGDGGGDGDDDGGKGWNIGGVIQPRGKNGKPLTANERNQLEQDWATNVAEAANIAKQCGKVPAGVDRLVEDLTKPRFSWKEILSRFLTEVCRDDYNWRWPNRRYMHMGFYIPDLRNETAEPVALIMDTSGSIGQRELNFFASELCGILSIYHEEKELPVVYVESKVAGHEWLNTGDVPPVLHPKGGGGTDFRPGFKWLEEQGTEPRCVIYLTDGYCSSFPEDPGYPVLWVLSVPKEQSGFNNPFGEVIQVDFEEELQEGRA